jgi:radical SAM superfamily enzyme YgiQ (UPF0313 family)
MKLDIYHTYKQFDYANYGYPIMLNVLKLWAESVGWTVRIAVCKEKDVDLNTDADVVAFSVYTQTAPMAYRLSAKLRERGKIVILGGPHFRGFTNDMLEEGRAHCDILARSICEEQWISLLRELEERTLSADPGRSARVIDDTEHKFRYPDNFYETFKHYRLHHLATVPTTLGCPFDCSFCNPFMQGKYILRDIQTIYNEIARTPRFRPLFIADAASGLNKRHTIELMKAIAPLKRDILMESTLQRVQDLEILDALAEGGVKWLTVGLESFNSKLDKLGKGSMKDNIKRLLDNAHERGMMVEGNFIIGLDSDGPEVFDNIYDFHSKSSLDIIIIDLLTPYPNTRLHYDMQKEGRIIDTDWEHYDYHHVVYRPKQMTETQLIDGFNRLYRALYSNTMVLKNLKSALKMGGIGNQSLGVLIYNVWAMYDSRRKEKALNRNKRHVEFLLKNKIKNGEQLFHRDGENEIELVKELPGESLIDKTGKENLYSIYGGQKET